LERRKLLDVDGINVRWGAGEEASAEDDVGGVGGMEGVPEQMALPVLAERHAGEAGSQSMVQPNRHPTASLVLRCEACIQSPMSASYGSIH